MSQEKPSTLEAKWEKYGLKCAVILVQQSHRCGYVGVLKTHIIYGIPYDNINVSVHGGLTFGAPGKDNDFLDGKDTYWVGFDCAHYNDTLNNWSLQKTIEETNDLAQQLSEINSLYDIQDYTIKRFLWLNDNDKILEMAKEAKLRRIIDEI
jgi:hypothetical protein